MVNGVRTVKRRASLGELLGDREQASVVESTWNAELC